MSSTFRKLRAHVHLLSLARRRQLPCHRIITRLNLLPQRRRRVPTLLQLTPSVPLLLQDRAADRVTRTARRRTTIRTTGRTVLLTLRRLRILLAEITAGRRRGGSASPRNRASTLTGLTRARSSTTCATTGIATTPTTTNRHNSRRRTRGISTRRLRAGVIRTTRTRTTRRRIVRAARAVRRGRRSPTWHSRRAHVSTVDLTKTSPAQHNVQATVAACSHP